MAGSGGKSVTLLQLLSNTLILGKVAPLLPLPSILALAATSHDFQNLLYETPYVFRYVDLSIFKRTAATPFEQIDSGGVQWRHQQMDEAITEEDFYSGPLRGIFERLLRKNVLQSVQTLVLDGLSVTAELIRELLMDERYNIRILSIREAKNLNQHTLMKVLRYAVRPTRAGGTPRLKGLYVFGPTDPIQSSATDRSNSPGTEPTKSISGVSQTAGAQIGAEWNERSRTSLSSSLNFHMDPWYGSTGKILRLDHTLVRWAETLTDCDGLITFDAVLCSGPRHSPLWIPQIVPTGTEEKSSPLSSLPPQIANVVLPPTGCERCHKSPEGPIGHQSPSSTQNPLFAPPPIDSSTVKTAQDLSRLACDAGEYSSKDVRPLYLRCEACLIDRFCERCHKWWCEDCYPFPGEPSPDQTLASNQESGIKVHLGFCVGECLVSEMFAAGGGGMWA